MLILTIGDPPKVCGIPFCSLGLLPPEGIIGPQFQLPPLSPQIID